MKTPAHRRRLKHWRFVVLVGIVYSDGSPGLLWASRHSRRAPAMDSSVGAFAPYLCNPKARVVSVSPPPPRAPPLPQPRCSTPTLALYVLRRGLIHPRLHLRGLCPDFPGVLSEPLLPAMGCPRVVDPAHARPPPQQQHRRKEWLPPPLRVLAICRFRKKYEAPTFL
jgi:hypothetical protein